MFGIKRKGRELSSRMHYSIRKSIIPGVVWFFGKIRYQARRRLFKRWGRNNPKNAMMYFAAIAGVLLLWNIGSLLLPSHHKDDDVESMGIEYIVDNREIFDGLMKINSNRMILNSSLQEYAEKSNVVAHRLDSLVRVENKSRNDSIEILKLYTKLFNK